MGDVMHDLNVLALFKGTERFIYVYDDASREALITAFRDAAADPRTSLTWSDAAVLTDRARRQSESARLDVPEPVRSPR
jgi:hypothetical protein